MRAVRYERYGPPEVLTVVEIDRPVVKPGEVLVKLVAAGLNPADYKVRRGATPIRELPSGIGREFSGVIVELGADVQDFAEGDSVIGTGEWVIGELCAVDQSHVMRCPEGLSLATAACLPVAPQTAWCALESQAGSLAPGSTIVISAAGGNVGFVAAQLARKQGLKVIGVASALQEQRLNSLGVIRVDPGPGLVQRILAVAPEGIDCVLDHSGAETIEASLELGVPRDRINSVSGYAENYAVRSVGRSGLEPTILAELSRLIVAGELEVPLEARYPLNRAVDAYRHLEQNRPLGRIIIDFSLQE